MVLSTRKNSRNSKSHDKNTIKIPENRQISSPPNTIEYKLSNEDYVQLGWTKKPTVRLARRITLYETEISKPHLKWHKGVFEKFYDGGALFFISDNSTGGVYYPNGKVAIKIDKSDTKNYYLYTVFSPGGRNVFEAAKPPRLIATFDTLGNGLVLDETGRIRLSYNQIGGICVDNAAALPLVWTWSCRKSVPLMETIYTEASAVRLLETLRVAVKAPKSFAGEKTTKVMPSADKKCFTGISKSIISIGSGANDSLTPVKTICLRLNEFISLRILDRKNISLRFLWGNKTARFELGFNVILDKPTSSYLKDISSDRYSFVKSRVEDELEAVKSNSSLFEILQEYRKNEKNVA